MILKSCHKQDFQISSISTPQEATKMETICSVCQISLGDHSWTLPCNHVFHPRCIRTVYAKNINQRDEETFQRLEPRCPNCRVRIHRRDIPRGRHVTLLERLEPAYIALPPDQKPKRLSRETFILQRQRFQEALDEFTEKRRRIVAAEKANQQSQSGPSGPCNRGASQQVGSQQNQPGPSGTCNRGTVQQSGSQLTRTGPVIVHLSSSSESSQEIVPGQKRSWAILSSSSSSSQDTVRSRSPRSPPVYRAPPRPVTDDVPQLMHPTPELQEVQMQISILEDQLEQVRRLPAQAQPIVEIDISDNESEVSEEEESPEDLKPTFIFHHINRGRYTKYLVRWSDGRATLNPTREVEDIIPELLHDYRRRKNTYNVAMSRAKAAAARARRDQM